MKRRLTPEEEALWRYVTRNDAPLHPDAPPPELDQSMLPPVPQKPNPPTVRKWKKGTGIVPPATPEDRPVAIGSYAGIDRATAERFRKGKTPFDGELDLHGLTRDNAYAQLAQFMERHHRAGSRCLLIITGKGPKGDGVLKELLPRWLAEPVFKSMILALDRAQPKHGGSGAYYLLLKRRR